MDKPIVRIFVWLGIMAVLTLLAMGIWYLACGGEQTTTSLKWLQLFQTFGTFLLPPILCAWWWSSDRKPFAWLKLDRGMSWQIALLAIAIMICAIPGINLLADLNSRVKLPESLDFIEKILREQEDAATLLTERFLQAENVGVLITNILLLALLPALSEELTFRGTLQQIFTRNTHVAIWIAAIVFSAVHMQFYGFVPRMLMGAMFGYMFVWTGSLWVPILMHFTNNGLAVISYYLFDEIADNKTWADTVGTGNMWWLGITSIIVTIALLGLIYSLTKKQKNHEIV